MNTFTRFAVAAAAIVAFGGFAHAADFCRPQAQALIEKVGLDKVKIPTNAVFNSYVKDDVAINEAKAGEFGMRAWTFTAGNFADADGKCLQRIGTTDDGRAVAVFALYKGSKRLDGYQRMVYAAYKGKNKIKATDKDIGEIRRMFSGS
jgi:hypothetical protein